MNREMASIEYNGNYFEIDKFLIGKLEEMNIDLDDEYISRLREWDCPVRRRSLNRLIWLDIVNRIYIGRHALFGRIVKLDKQGSEIAYFETVFDAVLDAINDNAIHKYSFEKTYEYRNFSKQESDFFGVRIRTTSREKGYQVVKELNTWITKCKNVYGGKNKTIKERYTERVVREINYETYLMQWVKYWSFCVAELLHHQHKCVTSGKYMESKYTFHDVNRCDDYYERIKTLLNRYSCGGNTCFVKVRDLNKLKGLQGIYVLFLPRIKGCYIGKTEKCFATRIPQHFTSPNSAFDEKYMSTDVEAIYVLPLCESMMMIDLVERDCIAVLGNEVTLNAMAGGGSIELIKSETYDPGRYLLNVERVSFVSEDAFREAKYRNLIV